MIIAGDIGGTKTNVALFQTNGSEVGPVVRQQTFPSSGYDSLEAILKEFTGGTELKIAGACFGIAAPVIEGRAKTPNLNWTVSAESLAELLRIDRVSLINDLEATAHGISALSDSQLLTLNTGAQVRGGHCALIAAGTGLGMAGIFYHAGRYYPMPSEGGHSDFTPHSQIEIDLFGYLAEKFGPHVSCERVLSGPGLFNVYSFLRDRGYAEEPAWLAEQIKSGDKTAAVSKAALSNQCELSLRHVCVCLWGHRWKPRVDADGHRRPLRRWRHRAEDSRETQRRYIHEGVHGQGQSLCFACEHSRARHSR